MKKIIFTMLVTSSTVLFAATEEPTKKTEANKEKKETILITKKNIREEKKSIKIELKTENIDLHTACVIGFAYNVWSHGGNFLEAVAIGDAICP